jgi:LysR family transcriptional regulator, transcription activator of glutamate synthase operon
MTRSNSKHDLTSLGVDTDVLRWFKKVAEGATVTEVSDLEEVTQSGVSRALARLEEQVGTPLLRRSGRRLRLTQAGEVFKPYVDALLHQLDDGMTAVTQSISPETGMVRLAFQQSLGVWLVPELVRTFRVLHPAVGFHLRQVTDQVPVGPLAGGDADLEISTRVFPTGHPESVRTRPIVVDPLGLAVPGDHRLAGQSSVRLADVAAEPFISLRPASALRRLTDELCARVGFRPQVVFEGDDLSNVWGFVAAGLGVAVVPAPRSPGPGVGRVRYLAIGDSGAERVIYLSWPAGRPLLPAAELFREHIVSQVRAGRMPDPIVTQNSS